MTSEIITFEKSLLQRLGEYMDILCAQEKTLVASQVRNEWCYYVEQVLEPIGWEANWRMPQKICEEMGSTYPRTVFVMVEGIDARTLTAAVNVLKSHDLLQVSKHYQAFLIDLYPTKNQENEILYINETADCLDKLRFFYNNVWQPWDDDDDDNQDWATAHLQLRVQLYYDMQSSVVSREMVHHIESLVQEARLVREKIMALEDELDDDDENVDERQTCLLMDLHVRMDQIKQEFELHEDPFKRALLVWKHQGSPHSRSRICEDSNEACVIWHGGSFDAFIELLTRTKSFISSEMVVKSYPSLQEALHQSVAGDTMLLCAGVHGIFGIEGLEYGGAIKGLATFSTTTLMPHNAGNVLLACAGAETTLENLTIDAHHLEIAILVREGTLKLRNCRLVEKSSSCTGQGIVVLGNARVEAQDCEFSGFQSAVYIHSKGEVALMSCKYNSCCIAIEAFDNAKLSMKNCTITDCTDYGIKIEMSQQSAVMNNQVGSMGLLKSLGEVNVEECSMKNNLKGDVMIVQCQVDTRPDRDNPTLSFPQLQENLYSRRVRLDCGSKSIETN